MFFQNPTRRSMNWVGIRHQVQGCRDTYCFVSDSKSYSQSLTLILEKKEKNKNFVFKQGMMDEPETQ